MRGAASECRASGRTNVLILHGGALGDLALTLQFALRLTMPRAGDELLLISRINPGDLSSCRPSVLRRSPEGLGLHWLHAESEEPPPERLRTLVVGQNVLNALSGTDSIVHRRLLKLEPRNVHSFDPRPKPGVSVHITTQWQRELEGQGLLFPFRINVNGLAVSYR